MNQASGYRSTYQQYPFLNKEEFTEACHHLDNKYCHATLGPLRKKWRLNVCTALDTSFAADSDYTTFLQITRPLEDESGLGDLETILDDFSMDEVNDDTSGADLSMKDLENSDQEVLHRRPQPNFGHVKYEIHLHPTYRAPCLWFSLHDLPQHEAAFDIETVFRRLVPTQFKDALRGGGPIGGISADEYIWSTSVANLLAKHHPITGVPSFFVHPCLLGDAMAGFDCSKEDYLMVWLGLVGGCVGLWVPREVAMNSRA